MYTHTHIKTQEIPLVTITNSFLQFYWESSILIIIIIYIYIFYDIKVEIVTQVISKLDTM